MKRKLILEFTDSHIKFLEVVFKKNKRNVRNCFSEKINGLNDEKITRIIAEKISFFHKLRTATLVVSRSVVTLHLLNLPSHDPMEIRRMIDLQLSRYTPFSREDVLSDYMVLEKMNSGYAKILLVLVQKKVIERYLQILKDAGLDVERIALSSSGFVYWHDLTLKENPPGWEPKVIINVDEYSLEICFCVQSRMLFSRPVNFQGKEVQDDMIFHIIKEVQTSLQTYSAENPGQAFHRVSILSSHPTGQSLKSSLAGDGSLKVDLMDPSEIIPELKSTNGVSYAAIAGCALLPETQHINLLPADIKKRRTSNYRRRQWVFLLGWFLALCILAGAILVYDFYRKSFYLKKLEIRLNDSRANVEDIERKTKQIDFLAEDLRSRIWAAKMMFELSRLVPDDTYFDSIHLQSDGSLVLQGASPNAASINEFQKSLINSPQLKDMALDFARKRKTSDGDITQFQIHCRVVTQGEKGDPKAVP